MALNPLTGGALESAVLQNSSLNFINVTTTDATLPVSGEANAGTGTPTLVVYNNQSYVVSSPNAGSGPGSGAGTIHSGSTPIPITNNNIKVNRLMWIERR